MRISRGPPEDVHPVNVGLMFFAEHPDDHFRYAKIVVVDKPDPTGEGMTEKIFRGPLDRQLADAIAYIKNYIVAERIFKHDDRPEASRFCNYPLSAVEEILSNAVYHKGYDIPEPITVTFTPECMTVLSLPGPDWSISDGDMKRYRFISSRCRNRRIGDFLKELRFIEGHNTGIPKIISSVKNNGSDMPIFETDAERSYMRVILPIHGSFRSNAMIAPRRRSKARRTSAEMREGILGILSDGEFISLSAISERMGHSTVSRSLKNHVEKLISEKIVEYSNPDSKRDPGQMIRIRKKRNHTDR
jgi:ATP-dependent DNA helicase RecG